MGKLSVFTTVLIRGRQRFREERRYPAVAFEDEGRGHEPGKVGNLQNLEKARQQKVPKPPVEMHPCQCMVIFIFFLKSIYLFIFGGTGSSLLLTGCLQLWGVGAVFAVVSGLLLAVASLVACRLSCSQACGILPDQGLNQCPLPWQTDSQPQDHRGRPNTFILDF